MAILVSHKAIFSKDIVKLIYYYTYGTQKKDILKLILRNCNKHTILPSMPPICSAIFLRSDPPTKPMVDLGLIFVKRKSSVDCRILYINCCI